MARDFKSLAAPYRQGLAQGRLRYQRCRACNAAQTLAHYACRACGNTDLVWQDAAGTGTVYSMTLVTRAPSEAFRALAPYVLVLVDLDEGPRLFGHGAADLAIGARVAATFFEHAGEQLVRFTPVGDGARQGSAEPRR